MSDTTETAAPAGQPLEHRRRRALWRATHRGTKELDWMVGRFAEAHLDTMDEPKLTLFERFLRIPDPDLHAWIMQREALPTPEFRSVVDHVRAFHKMGS